MSIEKPTIDHTNPEILREKYWGEGMTLQEIADAAGVHNSTVLYWMDKHDIKRRDRIDGFPEMEPLEKRFWDRVDKKSDGECWEWTGSTISTGYGDIRFNGEHKVATHVSVYLEKGSWPDDQVSHTCDNPPCVNPNHLWEGNQTDNMQDAIEKGRLSMGERHPNAKLTVEEVKEIKRRLADGESTVTISRDFDVSYQTIGSIQSGKNWKHVEIEL